MRNIKGYEGHYAITSCGKVWSYKSKKFLKPYITQSGYLTVNLSKNSKAKPYRIHRLVAEAYLDNPDNLPYVNHKNENKTHNYLNNLEWCDAEYNSNYGSCSNKIANKLKGNNNSSKKVMCIETGVIYDSGLEAERHTGIGNSSISRVVNGKMNTAGGFHWKYYDGSNKSESEKIAI